MEGSLLIYDDVPFRYAWQAVSPKPQSGNKRGAAQNRPKRLKERCGGKRIGDVAAEGGKTT